MQIPVTKTNSVKMKNRGCDGKSNVAWNPSPRHYLMGLGSSLDLYWKGKIASGGEETDDWTICGNELRTSVERKHLIEASIRK